MMSYCKRKKNSYLLLSGVCVCVREGGVRKERERASERERERSMYLRLRFSEKKTSFVYSHSSSQ